MIRSINGLNNDNSFEEVVEREWEECVFYLNWLRVMEGSNLFSIRHETMKKYWEDRLKALALVVHKEKIGWKNNVSWLKILESKYPSGIDWRYYLNEVQ